MSQAGRGSRWATEPAAAAEGAPNRTANQGLLLAEVQRANKHFYRAFLLKEELRALYHDVTPAEAEAHLDAWIGRSIALEVEPIREVVPNDP